MNRRSFENLILFVEYHELEEQPFDYCIKAYVKNIDASGSVPDVIATYTHPLVIALCDIAKQYEWGERPFWLAVALFFIPIEDFDISLVKQAMYRRLIPFVTDEQLSDAIKLARSIKL